MLSPVDYILQAFSPQVVIFSDANVDRACEVNGCKGLDQLFKPWQSKIERGKHNLALILHSIALLSDSTPDLTVPILSSLLARTIHPTYAIRFVSHAALLQSHGGGGGTVPYSPDIVVDIVSHLVAATTPGKLPIASKDDREFKAET